jgi:hypothetical protein
MYISVVTSIANTENEQGIHISVVTSTVNTVMDTENTFSAYWYYVENVNLCLCLIKLLTMTLCDEVQV